MKSLSVFARKTSGGSLCGMALFMTLQLSSPFCLSARAGGAIAAVDGGYRVHSGRNFDLDDAEYHRDGHHVNAGFLHDGDTCVNMKHEQEGQPGAALTYAHDAYSYSVTGFGCGNKVVGVLNADGVEGVSGYLYLENGVEIKFIGDWIADGIAEGVDNHGNLYTVKID